MHAKAPEREEFDMGVDGARVEFFLTLVRVDVRVPGQPCRDYELEGGGRVRNEDCVAEEGGGDEA